jgi:hypothetical protein
MSNNRKIKESILIDKNSDTFDTLKKVEEKISQQQTSIAIPANYIAIKLDSIGKLSAPTILHFRNYNMSEVLKLSVARDIDQHEVIIECLNSMCFEDFDCGNLTESEIKEILLTIFATWIDSHIRGLKYYKKFDDPNNIDFDIDDESNIGTIDFPIKDLKTIPIDEKFKEPINITINDITIKFRLPRFNDFIFTNEYIKEKYFIEERKFSDLENRLNHMEKNPNDTNITVDYKEVKMYKKYLKEKENTFMDILMMQIILQYNDVVLDTLEKKYEYYTIIPFDFWDSLKEWIKDFKFGIDENISFKPLLDNGQEGEPISRMFRIPLELFLPNNKPASTVRAKISFG